MCVVFLCYLTFLSTRQKKGIFWVVVIKNRWIGSFLLEIVNVCSESIKVVSIGAELY